MARHRKSKNNDLVKYSVIGIAVLVGVFLLINVAPTGKYTAAELSDVYYVEQDGQCIAYGQVAKIQGTDVCDFKPSYSNQDDGYYCKGYSTGEAFSSASGQLVTPCKCDIDCPTEQTEESGKSLPEGFFPNEEEESSRSEEEPPISKPQGATEPPVSQTTTFNCASVTCTPVDLLQIECSCK